MLMVATCIWIGRYLRWKPDTVALVNPTAYII